MSISIHELLAVARESEGVKAVQGDAMLCEKRFAPDTRYMVEFLVLKQTEKFGEAGIYHRYFLTKKAYYEMVELQNRGILRFQRLALVLEGTLHYLPVQTFFRDREYVFSLKKRRTYMPAFSMVIFSFYFLTIVSMNSNFLCVSLR